MLRCRWILVRRKLLNEQAQQWCRMLTTQAMPMCPTSPVWDYQ